MYFECFFTISPLSYQIFYRSTPNVNFAKNHKISLIWGMTSPCISCFQQKPVLKVHVCSDKNWKKTIWMESFRKVCKLPRNLFWISWDNLVAQKDNFQFYFESEKSKKLNYFSDSKTKFVSLKMCNFCQKNFHPPPCSHPQKVWGQSEYVRRWAFTFLNLFWNNYDHISPQFF